MSESIKTFLIGSAIGVAAVGIGVACWLSCGSTKVTPTDPAPAITAPAVEAAAPAPVPAAKAPAAKAPAPWLKHEPGTTATASSRVRELLYQKYQTSEAGSRATEVDGEPASELAQLDPESPLHAAGLRPGDKVISINGQPVGRSMEASKALFEQSRGETDFTLLVERNGERVVLTYSVD